MAVEPPEPIRRYNEWVVVHIAGLRITALKVHNIGFGFTTGYLCALAATVFSLEVGVIAFLLSSPFAHGIDLGELLLDRPLHEWLIDSCEERGWFGKTLLQIEWKPWYFSIPAVVTFIAFSITGVPVPD